MPQQATFEDRLLLAFLEIFKKQQEPNPRTAAIVILSAPHREEFCQIIEDTAENRARIVYGIQLIKTVAIINFKQHTRRSPEEMTIRDLLTFGPALYVNGETQQLDMMVSVAQEMGYPETPIRINCGNRKLSNTKTQFEKTRQLQRLRGAHVTFVTSSYHVLRALGTAKQQLSTIAQFDVLGVPLSNDIGFDQHDKVEGEVQRIIDYVALGDIADPLE